jgi:hypothetical protein
MLGPERLRLSLILLAIHRSLYMLTYVLTYVHPTATKLLYMREIRVHLPTCHSAFNRPNTSTCSIGDRGTIEECSDSLSDVLDVLTIGTLLAPW